MKSKILIILGVILISGALISSYTDTTNKQTPQKPDGPIEATPTEKPTIKNPPKKPTATPPITNPTAAPTNTDTPINTALTDIGEIVQLSSAAAVQEENDLQQSICAAFPASAARMPTDMLQIGVRSPDNLSNITFDNSAIQTLLAYKNINYFQCFTSTIYDANKECLLPFTTNINGSTEKGLIKMVFTGQIGAYQPQNPATIDPAQGDSGVAKNRYYGMDPMPMLNRASCEVSFQKSCPAKTGSILCGQCDYSSAGSDAALTDKLGQCFYCASTQKCSWGAGGLCSSYSCVDKNTGGQTGGKQTVYFVSCSGCQNAGYQSSYNYNGTNKDLCHQNYRLCQQCQPISTRTNCQW